VSVPYFVVGASAAAERGIGDPAKPDRGLSRDGERPAAQLKGDAAIQQARQYLEEHGLKNVGVICQHADGTVAVIISEEADPSAPPKSLLPGDVTDCVWAGR
jgi:hypothetical protein